MSNQFLPFAIGEEALVISQSAYAALTARTDGFQVGIAEPDQLNKVWRQSAFVAAAIGEVINAAGLDALDDGDLPTFVNNLQIGFQGSLAPYIIFVSDPYTGTDVIVRGGESDGAGGDVKIFGGSSLYYYANGGEVLIQGGPGLDGGDVQINGGEAFTGNGGDINLIASDGIVNGGAIEIFAGAGGSGTGGGIQMAAGSATTVSGGSIFIAAGQGSLGGVTQIEGGVALDAGQNGGDLNLRGGQGNVTEDSASAGGPVYISGGHGDIGGAVRIKSGLGTSTPGIIQFEIGEGSSDIVLQFNVDLSWTVGGSVGTAGQVLTSAGVGSSPTWETPTGGGASAPEGEIVFGTGASITSDASLNYDPDSGAFNITPAANAAPGNVSIVAAESTTAAVDGGAINIEGGASEATVGFGGTVFITGGSGGAGDCAGGAVTIAGGNTAGSGEAGAVQIFAGQGTAGANTLIGGGNSTTTSTGGSILLQGGRNDGDGGDIQIQGGSGATGGDTPGSTTILFDGTEVLKVEGKNGFLTLSAAATLSATGGNTVQVSTTEVLIGTASLNIQSDQYFFAPLTGPAAITIVLRSAQNVPDKIGTLDYEGENDNADQIPYVQISGFIDDETQGTEDGRLDFLTYVAGSNGTRVTIAAGVQVGAPTGGDKGSGTINVAGDIYKNNTAYANPDYVFEHYYRGEIVHFIENPGAKGYGGLISLDRVRAITQDTLKLPGATDAPMGVFERADFLLEKLEEAYLYLFELQDRVKELENGK